MGVCVWVCEGEWGGGGGGVFGGKAIRYRDCKKIYVGFGLLVYFPFCGSLREWYLSVVD